MAADLYLQLNPPGLSPHFFLSASPNYAFRRNGLRGFRACDLTDPLALMFDPRTLKIVERRALGGSAVIVVPPPPPDVNWEDNTLVNQQIAQALADGKPSYKIKDRYIKATPAQLANMTSLINMTNSGSIVIEVEGSMFMGNGSLFYGANGMLHLYDSVLTELAPTIAGRAWGYLINGLSMKWLEMEQVDIPAAGRGIYLLGTGSPQIFAGNPAAGHRVYAKGLTIRNIDGRVSDGAGSYYHSTWMETHAGWDEVKNNNATIGCMVANAFRFNKCSAMPVYLGYIEILNEIGNSRHEDAITFQGSSGGSAAYPGVLEKIFVQTSGGWDWNYKPGDPTYNGGNQLTGGIGYQNPARTENSQTALLIGDGNRSSSYELNTSFLTAKVIYAIGVRAVITQQAGHDVRFEDCVAASCPIDLNGTTYTGAHGGFMQVTDYNNGDTAPDKNGVQRLIWGNNSFARGNTMDLSSGGPTATGAPGDATKNSDASKSTGNFRSLRPSDGGAALLDTFHSLVAADGVTMGSSLA